MVKENQCCNCKREIENPEAGYLGILYCNDCIQLARKQLDKNREGVKSEYE